jgi:hypothetical protein
MSRGETNPHFSFDIIPIFHLQFAAYTHYTLHQSAITPHGVILMASFRMLVLGSFVTLTLFSYGCGGGTAEPAGQASSDLRANLEASSNAAAEVSKVKPKKTP